MEEDLNQPMSPEQGAQVPNKPEQIGSYFKRVARRGETVVETAREWWRQRGNGQKLDPLQKAGLLVAAWALAATLGGRMRQETQVSPTVSPSPSQVVEVLPSPSPTVERQPLSAEEQALLPQQMEKILEGEERDTQTPVELLVPEREVPLSDEEAAQLSSDFGKINSAVKELVRPEALQNNPELNYDEVLANPVLIDKYKRVNYFEDISGETEDKRNPDDRVLFFLPQGGRGSIAVTVYMAPDGYVYKKHMFALINQQGKVTSQFRKTMIPPGESQNVLENFYAIPPDAPMSWQFSPDDMGMAGTATADNKQFNVGISKRGYADLTIEELPPQAPTQPSPSVSPQAVQ